jgi:hypothetical protein
MRDKVILAETCPGGWIGQSGEPPTHILQSFGTDRFAKSSRQSLCDAGVGLLGVHGAADTAQQR